MKHKHMLAGVRELMQKARQRSFDQDQRHPVRNSPEYEDIKWAAVEELDVIYERILQEIKGDLAAIESTVGKIAEPMAEQLAKGAVADVFEAAAEALKRQIRGQESAQR